MKFLGLRGQTMYMSQSVSPAQIISRTLVINKVVRLKGTPYGAYVRRLETRYAAALHMYDKATLLQCNVQDQEPVSRSIQLLY